MSVTAFQNQYRQETIQGFEQRGSLFRGAGTKEFMMKGNTAIFLVTDSGGATATTRGSNGKIPGRSNNNTQVSCPLQEWHDKPEMTGFNIFASQGDQRAQLQDTAIGVINRKVDDLMITELSTGTQAMTSGGFATPAMMLKALAILGNADVDTDNPDNIFCALSHAAWHYLMQSPEFTSGDYVDVKPFNGAPQKYFRWGGINFIKTNRLSGRTTNAEKLLMWHRSAIGWAANTDTMDVKPGYNEEDDYSYTRCTAFMGSKLLQNNGVIVMTHDGSAVVAG